MGMMRRKIYRSAPKPVRKSLKNTNPIPSGRSVVRKAVKR